MFVIAEGRAVFEPATHGFTKIPVTKSQPKKSIFIVENNPFVFPPTQLEVSTTDFAGNIIEGPAILVITVIDQNDNRPIFKERRYTGEVLEGSPTGRWHCFIEGPW